MTTVMVMVVVVTTTCDVIAEEGEVKVGEEARSGMIDEEESKERDERRESNGDEIVEIIHGVTTKWGEMQCN